MTAADLVLEPAATVVRMTTPPLPETLAAIRAELGPDVVVLVTPGATRAEVEVDERAGRGRAIRAELEAALTRAGEVL